MVSWVLVLVPVVIVVQPLPLGDVPVGHQETMALAVDGEPHALEVLLLPAFPAMVITTQIFQTLFRSMCKMHGGERGCLRRVVVYPVDEPRDVAPLVGADDEALGRRRGGEQGHHAVAVVMLAVCKVVHIADVLGDDGQVLDVPVCLYCESVQEIPHNHHQCPKDSEEQDQK